MTLDEAIKHAEEKAEEQQLLAYNLKQCKDYGNPKSTITRGVIECETCADEHRQLAEWLKDYKRLKEQEPSEDCIARQPLIDNWNDCADMLMDEGDSGVVMRWILDVPSVTPVRKVGKWENGNPICPCCGEDKFKDLDADIWADWQPKYCPNCGSLMEVKG